MARIPIVLVERYRRRAKELRALAVDTSDADVKDALLQAAESYDEMVKVLSGGADPPE